jgi:hypothetical protein
MMLSFLLAALQDARQGKKNRNQGREVATCRKEPCRTPKVYGNWSALSREKSGEGGRKGKGGKEEGRGKMQGSGKGLPGSLAPVLGGVGWGLELLGAYCVETAQFFFDHFREMQYPLFGVVERGRVG